MRKSTIIAVDLAKAVFEIAVSDRPGRIVERHRLSRSAFLKFLGEQPPATVLLEACGSAHHWGRAAANDWLLARTFILVRAMAPLVETEDTDAVRPLSRHPPQLSNHLLREESRYGLVESRQQTPEPTGAAE